MIAEQDTFPTFTVDGFTSSDPSDHVTSGNEAGNAIVDAEFTEGTGDAESEQTRPQRERKKKNPSTRRVEELLYERGNLEQQNMYLAQQNMEREALIAEQARQLQMLQQHAQKQDQQTNQHYANTLDVREENINQDIKRAKEDGDIDAEIRAINELADIKAKRSTHALAQEQQQWAAAHAVDQEEYVPIEQQMQNPYLAAPRIEPVDEEFREWVEENPWYENNPRLRREADDIANYLEDLMTFNNQADMIGTPEFREAVTNLMADKYGKQSRGEAEEAQSQEEYYPPAQQQSYAQSQYTVAPPVHRNPAFANTGGNMAQQYVTQNNRGSTPLRTLTKEEFAIARHLPQRVRGESEADLVRRYAQSKSYPKSPLDGGTPHRLTIL